MKYLICFFIFLAANFYTQARVYIDIGEAQVKKSLVALTPLVYDGDRLNPQYRQHGEKIFQQIKRNLDSSGYFDFVNKNSFIENPLEISVNPYPKDPHGFRFENWRIIQTEFLMLSRFLIEGNQIKLRVFMYDILRQKPVFKKMYEAPLKQSISLSHFVCNDIIEYLTKRPGIFLTKIAAIRNIQGTKKELFVMNWDGSFPKQVSFHRSITLSPFWFPTGEKVGYTAFVYRKSFGNRRAHIFLYDLLLKRRRIISSHYGMNLGAAFFPSGKELLISLPSKHAGLDIFKYSLGEQSSFPIRRGPRGAINVEPAIHPRGRRIVFSSDRSGKVMLYEMNQRGEKLKQLTFVGSYNSSPDWSPNGDSIVFSGYSGGRFDIFTMNLNTRKTQRLTTAKRPNGRWADNESPSFSPDGSKIVFTSNRSGTNQLYIINKDGRHLRRITFDKFNYKSPKWSPLIKRFF